MCRVSKKNRLFVETVNRTVFEKYWWKPVNDKFFNYAFGTNFSDQKILFTVQKAILKKFKRQEPSKKRSFR